MSKSKLFQQWMIAYPHLTVLILTTPTLPRPLQADISRAFLKVTDAYHEVLEAHLGPRPHRVNPYWNYFLYHHHRHQWTDACPDLHAALGKLDELPPKLLLELDKGCEGLNTFLQIQTLTQTICLTDSRQQIFHCLRVEAQDIAHAVQLDLSHRVVVSLPQKSASRAMVQMR